MDRYRQTPKQKYYTKSAKREASERANRKAMADIKASLSSSSDNAQRQV